MKIISICDNSDICTGLQLTGIAGVVVDSPEEFRKAFKKAIEDRQVAIIVVAQRYAKQANKARLARATPLIVEL